MQTRTSLSLLAALALLAVAACQRDAIAPLTPTPTGQPTTQLAPALVEVTLSGIGSPEMLASASAPTLAAPSHARGISYSLSGPVSGGGSGDGTIELSPLTTGSFTQGVRGAGGYRYIWATFRVRNAQVDGTAYDTPRQNLTFFAATTDSTLGGSAIASMVRFDGTAADPAIATEILPTGDVSQVNGQIIPNQADVLQVLSESEAAAVVAPSGVGVLPYGFVVRNATDGGRTIAASPAAGQFDGVVTFAFKIPLQATAADDPFRVTALFLAEDDSETRLTQSIEEQTPSGEAAFLARATAIFATVKTVLPGIGTYRGASSDTRLLCSVRTAGASSSPAAYLINRVPASVSFTNSLVAWPLRAGGSVARDHGAVAVDAGGTPMTDVPVSLNIGTPSVLTAWGSQGGVRMVPRRDRSSTAVSASACGVASTPITLRTSGFSSLAAGLLHSLAIKSDGTVAAWGYNGDGQTTVPPDLTGVVQVAAGGAFSLALKSDGTVVTWGNFAYLQPALADVMQVAAGNGHSLALESDGTVVAWGDNSLGQLNLPPALADVVQVAGGEGHSLALKGDGTVVAWGNNSSGQTSVPPGLTGVVQVAAGASHSLALKSDGTVMAWGNNSKGQTSVPPDLTGVVQVAAGATHSLALKSDGTVVAWGGFGGAGQASVPTGLTGVVQVAAGFAHSLALKSDGSVVAWGDNGSGQTTVPTGLVATVP